ncbi:hypothetical protein SAMN05421854_108372 [Amycolatopsis rubida]|uniref:Uncharacterized protein n=1 Tax=Amycolatopsis rubida TaxID=112413 RepID=A0A1I5VIK0_9PSEU|nr:hypothetical protein SAMN05421854_108372 [Amycolatopsis rubida]
MSRSSWFVVTGERQSLCGEVPDRVSPFVGGPALGGNLQKMPFNMVHRGNRSVRPSRCRQRRDGCQCFGGTLDFSAVDAGDGERAPASSPNARSASSAAS